MSEKNKIFSSLHRPKTETLCNAQNSFSAVCPKTFIWPPKS